MATQNPEQKSPEQRIEQLQLENKQLREQNAELINLIFSLSAQSAEFEQVLVLVSDWVWKIDVKGKHTYSNPAVYGLLGYTPEEILQQPAFSLMSDEDQLKMEQIFRLAVEEKIGWENLEICLFHKNGNPRYF
jgi:PAS domain S-box-containing protein